MCDPATGALVECGIGGMTPDDLAAYVQRVGVVTGGLHILGVWLERKAREIFGVE